MFDQAQSNTVYNSSGQKEVLFDVITKPDCPYCVRAKQLLKSKGFAFREYEIGIDILREDVVTKFPNVKTVPIICYRNEYIGGFTQLEQFLSELGG